MNFVAEERRWYAEALLRNTASQHFFSFAILRKEEWEEVLRARGFAQEEGVADRATQECVRVAGGARQSIAQLYDETELSADAEDILAIRARYQLDNAGAMLIAALRYSPDVEPEPVKAGEGLGRPLLPRVKDGQPTATIGRFARANWYKEMIGRLDASARATSGEAVKLGLPVFPIKQWHRFSNSRFPEKALAVAAGLGTIGRNGLLIARRTDFAAPIEAVASGAENGARSDSAETPGEPDWSSAIVLGLMLLPFDVPVEAVLRSEESRSKNPLLSHQEPLPLLFLCGACSKCVDACPTKALAFADTPLYERARCIQNYTSIAGALPDFIQAAWTTQLYGCDRCLEACPYFKPDPHAYTALGRIGGVFDATSIAAMNDDELRAFFKGSALDQKWIAPAALRRNAELVKPILKPTRI